MKQILVVDDDPFIRDLIVGRLLSDSVTIATAGTVAEANQIIVNNDIDLVLLDLDLKGESGIDVLKKIRMGYRSATTKVIIFSNNDDPEVQKSLMDAGADAFYVKALMDMKTLQEHVAVLLR